MELKNAIENFNSRLNQAEEKASDLKDRLSEIIKPEEAKRKKEKETGKDSLSQLLDTIKRNNPCITRVLEGEKRKKGADSLFKETMLRTSQIWGEIWASKFMNLISPPKRLNLKRYSPRHIIIRMSEIKDKRKILKEEREKIIFT